MSIDYDLSVRQIPAGSGGRTQAGISVYDIEDAISIFKRSLLNDKVSIFGTGHSPCSASQEIKRLSFADLNNGITHPDVKVSLGSETLSSNLFVGGDNRNSSYMTMGHELGHVWSMLKHKKTNLVSPMPNKNGTMSLSEVDAMFWENVLRIAAGYGTREYYHSYTSNGVPVFELPVQIIARGQFTVEPSSQSSNKSGVKFPALPRKK